MTANGCALAPVSSEPIARGSRSACGAAALRLASSAYEPLSTTGSSIAAQWFVRRSSDAASLLAGVKPDLNRRGPDKMMTRQFGKNWSEFILQRLPFYRYMALRHP